MWVLNRDDNGKQFISLKSIIEHNSGCTAEELTKAHNATDYTVYGIDVVAEELMSAITKHIPIHIVGDFDVDGMTATTILVKLLRELGADVDYTIPLKYTEGYGISESHVEKLKEKCLLVTVDNGITCLEAVQKAKEKGNTVIILDHHLAGDDLPHADIIIDPTAFPNTSDYSDYCGAGIALKLAEGMLVEGNPLLPYLKILAMLGTIADMVSLTGDNRRIVKEGLELINKTDVPNPIKALKEANWLKTIDETTIGFTIVPQLNALCRLNDDGARKVVEFLLDEDSQTASLTFAKALKEINETRKKMVLEASESIIRSLKAKKEIDFPIFFYKTGLNIGIVGLIAMEVAKEFNVPTFIATNDESGCLRGSVRSRLGIDTKELMDRHKELFIKYGGHREAGGFSITVENYMTLAKAVTEDCKGLKREDTRFYDAHIQSNPQFIKSLCRDLTKYAPYGKGNPRPIFKISCKNLKYEEFGKEKEHIKIILSEKPRIDIMYFNKADEFKKHVSDDYDVYGTLSYAEFANERFLQIVAEDIQKN